MNSITKITAAAAAATTALIPLPAGIAAADGHGADHAVFVQTVESTGNHVIAYHRSNDGHLTATGSYSTGGTGLFQTGAAVDPLASQGGLTYDQDHALLFSVNSGSDSVSVFSVKGDKLSLRQTIASGGSFPSSIAVHGDLVEVLNAGGTGNVSGFEIRGGHLKPMAGSARSLGLSNAAVPFFLTSPGQVGFSADGDRVIVTTKANGTIDTFAVGEDDRLSASPVVTHSAGAVPFGFDIDDQGRVVVVEAGSGTVTSYDLADDGSLSPVSTTAGGQKAACWITEAKGHFYVANAASSTLSGFNVDESGAVSLIGATGVVANTAGGPVDLATSRGGQFVYLQQGGAGSVQAFSVHHDGTLSSVGTVGGLPAMEGIVAI